MSTRLALLFCAVPRVDLIGQSVYVPAGNWRIQTEYFNTSKCSIEISPSVALPEWKELTDLTVLITGPVYARVKLLEKGNEQYINVILERLG